MLFKGILIAVIVFVLDQAHKWYMIEVIDIAQAPIHVTSFFNLVMVWNSGISFGSFQNIAYGQYIFSILAIIISIVLLSWLKKTDDVLVGVGIGCVLGGAFGNMADRLQYGAVADFFYFHIEEHYWPAFNIADIAVCIGAFMLCVDSLFYNKNEDTK